VFGVANESPIFSTAYTPVYSNEGFAIFGLLLQEISNKPIEMLFNNSLVKPLNLTSTYFNVPSGVSGRSVIPQNPDTAGWRTAFGVFSP
jgi:CubicO group peptidase (beta-lactamase class C family)